MVTKIGEWGHDTGLKYKDGSPVNIGDLAAFDPETWYKNNTREGASDHLFVVGYENGEIMCKGSVSTAGEYWSLVTKFDRLPAYGNCRVTLYDRSLIWIKTAWLISPTNNVAHMAGVWRLLNLGFFDNITGSARWMVVDQYVDTTTFEKDYPLLIDLS